MTKKTPRELRLPKLRADVSVAPETLDAAARTVEVRFYSGAAVQRMPLFDDPYTLKFSLDKGAVRLDRFNHGAPLVDNHSAFGPVSESVLGVVEQAWLEADGGHARVKIAEDRPDILARLRDGILRNFSMGAVIHKMLDITEKGDEYRSLLATDWEPHELSIVPVGADPGAQALAHQQPETFRCELTMQSANVGAPKETEMSDEITIPVDPAKPDAPAPVVPTANLDLLAEQAAASTRRVDSIIAAKRAHNAEIKRLGAEFQCDSVFVQRHIKLGTSIDDFAALASEEMAKTAPVIQSGLSVAEDYEAVGWRLDRMAEALSSRGLRAAPPEPARQYALSSIAEMAFECLALNGRTRGRNLDARRRPEEVVELALHTTSDFPLLLANVLNKMMQPAYEQATPTYRRIGVQKTFNDFRAHQFLKAGDFPALARVDEHGEFTSGTMGEGSEAVTALSYGRVLGISRQILVNDDVGAFADLGGAAARRVTDFENAQFYTTCILAAAGLGPTLVEGAVAVYNAAHGNITAAGALSNTLLGEALALMLAQTSLGGMKLNVMPNLLAVSPASFVLAKTLVSEIYPAQASNVNPFAGQLEVVTDANLTGTRFYVLATSPPYGNYVYGSLAGQGGPVTEVQNGFRVDGVEVKVRRDFGCGAVDFRFGVTGAGA